MLLKKQSDSTSKHVGSTIISAKLSNIIMIYLLKDHKKVQF